MSFNSSKILITCVLCVLFKKSLLSSKTVNQYNGVIVYPEGPCYYKTTKAWIKHAEAWKHISQRKGVGWVGRE